MINVVCGCLQQRVGRGKWFATGRCFPIRQRHIVPVGSAHFEANYMWRDVRCNGEIVLVQVTDIHPSSRMTVEVLGRSMVASSTSRLTTSQVKSSGFSLINHPGQIPVPLTIRQAASRWGFLTRPVKRSPAGFDGGLKWILYVAGSAGFCASRGCLKLKEPMFFVEIVRECNANAFSRRTKGEVPGPARKFITFLDPISGTTKVIDHSSLPKNMVHQWIWGFQRFGIWRLPHRSPERSLRKGMGLQAM